MTVGLLIAAALQSAATPLPPEDAMSRYDLCVSRMAWARAGNDPSDATAEVSAIACKNLQVAAVDQMMAAAEGEPEDARRRVADLLELNARRDAVARNAIVKSYEDGL